MLRRLYILALALTFTFAASAQIHRVGFGVSAGANTMFADTALTNLWGPLAGIEGYYACMFAINNTELLLGPRTGLEAFWSMSGFETPVSEQFTNTDYLGHKIDYTVSGEVSEKYHHVYVGIPLMLALKYRGFVAGVGIKARALLWNTGRTDVTHMTTTAYYPEFDIAVVDEPKMGVVKDMSYDLSCSRTTPEWHVAVAAEAGYEWEVKKNQWIGLRVFADYDIWNSFTQPEDAAPRVVDIAPITAANKTAEMTVTPICEAALAKFSALHVGLTISYTFDFIDTSHHCNCLPY